MSQVMLQDVGIGSEAAVLSPGRVVAWRRWRLRPDSSGQPFLWSAHEDRIWLDRTLRAECDPSRTWAFRVAVDDRGHQPPGPDCRCGIYAHRTAELARPIGPGVWVHGRVLIGGPMFVSDSGYRGREATIDGPLELGLECVGGDDLFSPTRCFKPLARIKFGPKAFYPVCDSHRGAPVDVVPVGSFGLDEFLTATSRLAGELGTTIAVPAPI